MKFRKLLAGVLLDSMFRRDKRGDVFGWKWYSPTTWIVFPVVCILVLLTDLKKKYQ
jgi:hypothetical protein